MIYNIKDLELKYGILKTEDGYIPEEINETHSYDMYIAKGDLSTASYSLYLLDARTMDVLPNRQLWMYSAQYYWGCFRFEGYSIRVYLEKGECVLQLEIKGDDGVVFYYYVNIMIDVLSECNSVAEVDQLLATYKSRLKEDQDTLLNWRYFNK